MALLNKKTNIHRAEESKFVLIFWWGIPFKAEIKVFEFPNMSFKCNHAEREIIWRVFVIVISDARGFHLGGRLKPSLLCESFFLSNLAENLRPKFFFHFFNRKITQIGKFFSPFQLKNRPQFPFLKKLIDHKNNVDNV